MVLVKWNLPGDIYEGEWSDNFMQGQGKFTHR